MQLAYLKYKNPQFFKVLTELCNHHHNQFRTFSSPLIGNPVCYSPSHVRLFAIPWTIACQAPLSMEFSRQEYWSELPFPSPGDPPNSGTEPKSPALLSELPGKPQNIYSR